MKGMREPDIGPYKVLKILGAGSFAQVSVAEHKKTGEKVALKVVDTSGWNESNRARRTTLLKREIRLCRLLHHPNIIKMMSTMQEKKSIILIMEHCSGGDLDSYRANSKHGFINEEKCRGFFNQIISGVDYLHKNFMTHRDIKPANIILDSKHTTPKLIDFGFTNIFDDKEKMKSFLGSPHFAAPELLTGTKYEGPMVDIWSLGVTLYNCLTGALPFQAQTMEQLMDKIMKGKVCFPDHVSKEAHELIQGMLTVNCGDRIRMHDVLSSVWLTKGGVARVPDFSIPRDLPIDAPDPEVLAAVQNFGFEDDELNRTTLAKPENSVIKSVYCLLIEATARETQTRYIEEAKAERKASAVYTTMGTKSGLTVEDRSLGERMRDMLLSPIANRRTSLLRSRSSSSASKDERAKDMKDDKDEKLVEASTEREKNRSRANSSMQPKIQNLDTGESISLDKIIIKTSEPTISNHAH